MKARARRVTSWVLSAPNRPWTTASRSAPWATSGAAFSRVMPPITQIGTCKHADSEDSKGKVETIIDHVVEQRVSNLAQGLLTLGTMSGPLLIVLRLIPQAVMAGLFMVMGLQALEANGITAKLVYLLTERELTEAAHPLQRVRTPYIWAFVAVELVGFGLTFAITQTIAAVGFPVIIFMLVPVRTFLMPCWFRPEELAVLDEPTASAFTLESVGGSWGGYEESSSSGTETPVLEEDVESGAIRMGTQGRKQGVGPGGDQIEEVGSARRRHG